MSNQFALSIKLDDGSTITASPAPEESWQLPNAGDVTLKPTDDDSDTLGHAQSADILVDVEGHAMTLRLPSPADAVALRRALAAGVITATIVAAGAVAAMQVPQPTAGGTTNADDSRPAAGQDYNRHGSNPE